MHVDGLFQQYGAKDSFLYPQNKQTPAIITCYAHGDNNSTHVKMCKRVEKLDQINKSSLTYCPLSRLHIV